MRHITEGDLHAYLDGGLEAYPPERADDVRRHLEACTLCRDRLSAEGEKIERASEILAHTGPSSVEMPPFEELRSRAMARDHAPETPEGSPLGYRLLRGGVWAASVILALGVGWVGGRDSAGLAGPDAPVLGEPDLTLPAPEGPTEGVASAPADELGDTPVSARDAGAGSEGDRIGEPPPPSPSAVSSPDLGEPPPAGAGQPAVDLGPALVDVEVEPRRVAAIDRIRALTDPGAFLRVDSIRPVTRWGGRRGDPLGADLPASSPLGQSRATPPEVVTSTLATDPGVGIERARRRAAPERGEASDELRPLLPLSRLAIPGVDVVSVEWVQVAPGVEGVRVVQRLVTGVTVELRFGGLTTDEEVPDYLLEESLPDGINQVHTAFAQGWLVARARLEPEDIRSLVALIR